MKNAFIILLSFLLFGCITKKENYLIILEPDQAHVQPKNERETIPINRFEKQFYKADSVFMSKLRKASKEAREATNKY
ncbi:hypothetical protein [Dysgonomonas termitidis]|uniref:Lipoprotein n=1 Tax=Dysgonomonas termitidis TaxID=1516126 RepID=A0ABV9KQX3_9BACT